MFRTIDEFWTAARPRNEGSAALGGDAPPRKSGADSEITQTELHLLFIPAMHVIPGSSRSGGLLRYPEVFTGDIGDGEDRE